MKRQGMTAGSGRGIVILLLAILLGVPAWSRAEVGIHEKLGQPVPLDLELIAEDGRPVRLGSLIDRPVVLSLVYYRCPSICNVLLAGLSDTVERLDLEPGADYRIVTVSFDWSETAEVARRKKANYFKRMEPAPAPEAWRFLTASKEASRALTDAVGFRYEKRGQEFDHPGTLIILSPQGKITRYLYGVQFLPFDLKMALYEANRGRVGPTINKILVYCFSYDPEGKTYVFNLLKVTGTVTLVVAGLFVLFLFLTTRRHRPPDPEKD